MGGFFSKSRAANPLSSAQSTTLLESPEQNVSVQADFGVPVDDRTVARINRHLKATHDAALPVAGNSSLTWRQTGYMVGVRTLYWSTVAVYAYAPALYSYLFFQDDEQEDAWRLPVGIVVGVGGAIAYGMLASLSLDGIKAEFSRYTTPLRDSEKQRQRYRTLKRSLPLLTGLASAITASHITYEVSIMFKVPKAIGFTLAAWTHGITTLVCDRSLRRLVEAIEQAEALDKLRQWRVDSYLSSQERMLLLRQIEKNKDELASTQLKEDMLKQLLNNTHASNDMESTSSQASTYLRAIVSSIGGVLGFFAPYFTYHVAVDAVEKLSEALGITHPALIAVLSYLFGICAYSSWGALASEGTARSFGRTFDVISEQCFPKTQQSSRQLYLKRGFVLFISALLLGVLSLVMRLEVLDQYTESSPFMKFVILCNLLGPGNAYFWVSYDFLVSRLKGNDLAKQRIALLFEQVERLLREANDTVINEIFQQQENEVRGVDREETDRICIDSVICHSIYGDVSVDVPVVASLEQDIDFTNEVVGASP